MMIEFRDVSKSYRPRGLFAPSGAVRAVDGVSFTVERNTIFGLVGESGSGKSTIAKIVTGILQPDSGTVSVSGKVDMVFQDPYGSLNPRLRVRDIVGEALRAEGMGRHDAEKRVRNSLSMVGLDPSRDIVKYPHQFSGGERQRVSIARAIVRMPNILVLDEPVSSLDVSIQAGVLNLLKDLREEMGLTYLFISHDLRVVEFMSDTVAVMRAGRIVETAPARELYLNPRSEYTKELLRAIPSL